MNNFISVAMGVVLITWLAVMLWSLIKLKQNSLQFTTRQALIQNSGSLLGKDNTLELESFYKSEDFLKMVNNGEDLCLDDIKFDYIDYCGNVQRMFEEGRSI